MGRLPGPLTVELPEGDNFPVGNVNFAETESFCRKISELGHQTGELPKAWSSGCPRRRSGNTRAAPERQRPRHSATNLAVARRTSKASRTTEPNRGHHLVERRKSAAIRPTPGDCTTCTATPSSGAAIGIIPNCPAVLIRIYI
jgi:hypothetical protein